MADASDPTPPLDALERRALLRLGVQGAALLTALFGVGWIAGRWLRAPLLAVGERFVAEVGAPGVALAFLLADVVPVPIPPDLFSVFALVGGAPFGTIVAWGTLGALGGSAFAWGVGRVLGRTAWFRGALGRLDERVATWVRRWGGLALLLVIVSPLPFEVGAWTCSAMGMPLWRLLAWASLRGLRIAAWLALFRLGWVDAG